MEKAQLQVELLRRVYDEDVIYASIGLRGGYAVREYLLGATRFIGSYAFYNLLFNYYRKLEICSGFKFDVLRSSAIISLRSPKKDFMRKLRQTLALLFASNVSSSEFEEAKKRMKDSFSRQYTDGVFRSRYKAIEVSDLNKGFKLSELIRDIENIQYDTFRECVQKLLVPGNICIYIAGDTDSLDIKELYKDYTGWPAASYLVRMVGRGFDPYLRQNAHIVNLARKQVNLIIESLSFINPNTTVFSKRMVADLLSERLTDIRGMEISVDALDASIVFESDELRSYRSDLNIPDEESYEHCKKKVLEKYITLMYSAPDLFAMTAADGMLQGLYMDQYIGFLDTATYAMFRDICRQSRLLINEAQIVMAKGGW